MTEVRKHQRRTASGKTTTVRHHTRDTGDGARIAWEDRVAANQPSAAPRAGSAELAALSQPTAQWDDFDGDEVPYGDWWASDEPGVCDCGHPLDEACGCRCVGNHPEPRRPGGDGMCDCGHSLSEACGCRCLGNHASARSPADRRARTEAEFTRMQAQMREWRARDIVVPPAEPDTSPLGRALGTDTQEGADKMARLRAYREAGYDGPLDDNEEIPDPDDPANYEWLHAGAALSAHGR